VWRLGQEEEEKEEKRKKRAALKAKAKAQGQEEEEEEEEEEEGRPAKRAKTKAKAKAPAGPSRGSGAKGGAAAGEEGEPVTLANLPGLGTGQRQADGTYKFKGHGSREVISMVRAWPSRVGPCLPCPLELTHART
jgi:hypothetical protein